MATPAVLTKTPVASENDFLKKASGALVNSLFMDAIDNPVSGQKLAVYMSGYVREFIREEAFMTAFLPPERLEKNQLRYSPDHEAPTKIVELEPLQRGAMYQNFRGEPTAQYIDRRATEYPLVKLSSPEMYKAESELIASTAPILKIVEENILKDMSFQRDKKFMALCRRAVALSGNSFVAAGPLNKQVLVQLFRPLHANKRVADALLMSQTTYDTLLALDSSQLGLTLTSEVTIEGYTHQTLLGKRIVTTLKEDLVPFGEVWVYSKPEFLGEYGIFADPKFMIWKERDQVHFYAYSMEGMILKGARALAKVTLV